ncbi:MAG TPA: head-tail connector protein [Acidimicrobiia bacterium]
MADYCTLSELKASLRITDNVDNSLLAQAITSASGWVDGYCERTFEAAGTAATARDYMPSSRYAVLPIDDAVAITSVKIDDGLDGTFATTLTTADWQAEPINGRAGGLSLPFMRIRPLEDGYWPLDVFENRATVRVTARWGWSATPGGVTQATILQAARIFTRLSSPLGVAGFGDMGVVRVSRFVDPDVEALLQPYRRIQF